MKKIILFILVLILSLAVFCGCEGKKESTETTSTEVTTTSDEDVTPATTVSNMPVGDFSPEDSVKIYMDNIDVWKHTSDTPVWYGYLFLDLNSDGVLELVKTTNTGYELASKNNYYRIDKDTRTVVEIPFPEKDEDNQCDFNGGDYPDLYKDNSTGQLRFMTYDQFRHEGLDNTTTIGELYMDENYTIKARSLWSLYFDIDEETFAINSATYKVFDEDGNENIVSEETYLKTLEDFENENTNLNLQFKTVIGQGDGSIDSKDFADLDYDSQYKLLLESYNAYKY